MARIVDGLILGVAFLIPSIVITALVVTDPSIDLDNLTVNEGGGLVLATILIALVSATIWFAYEFFMLKSRGQTLGKIVMGIRVIPVGGNLATPGLSVETAGKRAGVLYGPQFIRALAVVPVVGTILSLVAGVFMLLNVLWLLWDKPLQQALHDKVANTIVVKVK